MDEEFEHGRQKLLELIEFFKENTANLNEATTRLYFIDALLFECLGWTKADVIVEESYRGTFADYVFAAPRKILTIEAKREGDYFEVPVGSNRINYSLSTITKDNKKLEEALEQVSAYCQKRGIPFGAVSNGHQIVLFIAARTDGSPPLAGRCLVFPSLRFMEQNFLQLWNAISKPAVLQNNLSKILLEQIEVETPPKLSANIINYPGVKQRNVFQADLQIVSELVFEDIPNSRDFQKPFIAACYSQSGALSQYSLLSKNILRARYAALFDSESPGPTAVPAVKREGVSADLLAGSLSRRPILLIGDVGVGKTTFINHFSLIEAEELLEDAIVVYIDLGTQATLTTDLKEHIVDAFAAQVLSKYEIDIFERNFIHGVYHFDLDRFEQGLYSDLKDTNPEKYKEAEIRFLEERTQNKEQHLFRSIDHITNGQRKQVVLFIDNADQRDFDVQQQAFLAAQGISKNTDANVFVSLRPETFHESVKSGALSGYHPKAFTISPPRIDIVIQKRLEYALRITGGEIKVDRSISLELGNLDVIIRAFMHSLDANDDLLELIDNISGGNVRLALDLVKGFFGSGHVDTYKIVEILNKQRAYVIPVHEFLRAIIYRDNEKYDPSRSPIANIFDVSTASPKEHFLLPSILAYLQKEAIENKEGFVESVSVYNHAQSLGFTPEQIDGAFLRASAHKLIEFSGRRNPSEFEQIPPAIRITTSGAYQVKKLCQMFTYIDAIIVDLPIFDDDLREKTLNVEYIRERINRAKPILDYFDETWNQIGTNSYFDWPEASRMVRSEIASITGKLAR